MAEVFYHDVDEATLAAAAEYEGVPSRGLFAEPLPLDAWPDVPTTVLAGRDDRLFPLAFQQRVARERLGLEEVAEIDGGHLPMLARPRELAERLVDLA
jgi:pimeloyl-ACP methyl ester carboxylesterase